MTDLKFTKPARKPRAEGLTPSHASAPKPRRKSRAKGFVPEPIRSPVAKAPEGKLGIVTALLQRPQGATLAQISEATGWQAHSVRGALAGSLKKKHRLIITADTVDGVRTYRSPPLASIGAQGQLTEERGNDA